MKSSVVWISIGTQSWAKRPYDEMNKIFASQNLDLIEQTV
jgi:hypothetical protein